MNPPTPSQRESARPSAFVQSFARRGASPAESVDHDPPATDPPNEVWIESDQNAGAVAVDPAHTDLPGPHLTSAAVRESVTTGPGHVAFDQPSAVESEESSALSDPPLSQPIVPVWEVDVFDVPTTVADLFFEGQLLSDLGARMTEAVAGGLGSMVVTSTEAGEGRSSIAIGMALAAASSGLKVALVDADTQHPTLIDDLRLDVEFGWVEAIRSGLPIGEVAVRAIEDGVTLIPLLPANASMGEANPAETIQLIECLQNHYDMLIIDGPAGDSLSLYRIAPVVDSAIVVRDMSRTSTDMINAFSYRLKDAGVKGIGVVENFTA